MKKILLLIVMIATACMDISAKDRYIGKYMSAISENINGTTSIDSCNDNNEFSKNVLGGRLKVIINHEIITPELEKSIKRMTAAAGWTAVSGTLSGISSIGNAVGGNYNRAQINSIETNIAAKKVELTSEQIKNLETLEIDIFLENLSTEELLVNDMENGLVWFIQPHSCINIHVPTNSTLRNLRASTIKFTEQPISIINIVAKNETRCFDIDFENELYMYRGYKNTSDDMYNITSKRDIYKVNKRTVEKEPLSQEEYKAAYKDYKTKKNY